MAMGDYDPLSQARKLAHRGLSTEAVKRYEPALQKHTLLLLKDLLSSSDEFEAAIRL